MKILLDTHIFIWWNGDISLLSPQVRALCESRETTLVLSLVSIWEMQIKSQLGKLAFNQSLPEIIRSQRQTNRLELLPIKLEHIYALGMLPAHHRDPFDRLLIAQSLIEGMALVTSDAAFKQYNIKLVG